MPCPPPMQAVANPYRPPRRDNSWSRVRTRRVPVAPSGCPSAIAPRSRQGRSPRCPSARPRTRPSACVCHLTQKHLEPFFMIAFPPSKFSVSTETKQANKPSGARSISQSVDEPVPLTISMQQLFEKTFVGKLRQIVLRPQLEKNRHRDAPGHPLTRIIFQIPAPPQKTFHD
jgi:hypothetical protein